MQHHASVLVEVSALEGAAETPGRMATAARARAAERMLWAIGAVFAVERRETCGCGTSYCR